MGRSNKLRTKIQNASLHFCVGKIGKFLLAAFCFACEIGGLQDGGRERAREVVVLLGTARYQENPGGTPPQLRSAHS